MDKIDITLPSVANGNPFSMNHVPAVNPFAQASALRLESQAPASSEFLAQAGAWIPLQIQIPTQVPIQVTQVTVGHSEIPLGISQQPIQIQLGSDNNIPIVISDANNTSGDRDVSEYVNVDQRTHAYLRPDTYVGSRMHKQRDCWIFDYQHQHKMVLANISFPPACDRLFIEGMSNAVDNVWNSMLKGYDPRAIEVTATEDTITIQNYGLRIPVELTKTHDGRVMYAPQMIFGVMLSGTNYGNNRTGGGTNGIGGKAINIFSVFFQVEVWDATTHKYYRQIWRNNMLNCEDPTIIDYPGEFSSVKITYTMDFAYFQISPPVYPPEAIALFMRHTIDASFNSGIPTFFNGQQFSFPSPKDYGRLYFGDMIDTAIEYYLWEDNTVSRKRPVRNHNMPPKIMLMIIDTPDMGANISFANGIPTYNGGVHVNAVLETVARPVINHINEAILAKLEGRKKVSKKDKEVEVKKTKNGKPIKAPKAPKTVKGKTPSTVSRSDKINHTINIGDVRNHISFILSVRVVNPHFDAQSKTSLESPSIKLEIDEALLKPIYKWQLIMRLYAELEAKQMNALTKGDKMTGNRCVISDKYTAANWAGTARAAETALLLAEGDSGDNYSQIYTAYLKARNQIGTFPLRGKVLNVAKADLLKLEKNKEFKVLRVIIGLEFGLDYLKPENFSKLEYGGVMIMSDADIDGVHIRALIINIFNHYYPSLLARGYVCYWRTPILKMTKGKKNVYLYTKKEFDDWQARTPNWEKWTKKYYKGLGGNSNKDVKEHVKTPKKVICLYDAACPEAMKLAFDPKTVAERKEWMSRAIPEASDIVTEYQPISEFIYTELIHYNINSLVRAIPSMMDSFKESHRKVIFATSKTWPMAKSSVPKFTKTGKPKKTKKYEQRKVPEFANIASGLTDYHHNADILNGVIIGLARKYGGSINNINLLRPIGQFGSAMTGKAAASRYLHTCPSGFFRYVIRREDDPILVYNRDENGRFIEPHRYYPILPLAIVNGCSGVATGWSSFVPNYNPIDVINCLLSRLSGTKISEIPEIYPWYRFFPGFIRIVDRQSGKTNITTVVAGKSVQVVLDQDTDHDQFLEAGDDPEVEPEVPIHIEIVLDNKPVDKPVKKPRKSMATYGIFEVKSNGVIVVKALPLGLWGKAYKKWLNKQVGEGRITKYEIESEIDDKERDINTFTIYGFKGTPNHVNLNLVKCYGLGNMFTLNAHNVPVKCDTIMEMLETFYTERLPIYKVRKDYVLNQILKDIRKAEAKMKFIQLVLDKKIIVERRKKADIKQDMKTHELDPEIFDLIKLSNLTEDELAKLQEEIGKLTAEYNALFNRTIEDIWAGELKELLTYINAKPSRSEPYYSNLSINIADINMQIEEKYRIPSWKSTCAPGQAEMILKIEPPTTASSSQPVFSVPIPGLGPIVNIVPAAAPVVVITQ